MSDLKRVGLTFEADGAVNFRKTLTEVNAAVKENYSMYKLVQSEWDKATTTQEKLRAKQEYLSKQTDVYSDKVNVLNMQLREMEANENTSAAELDKKKSELNNAQSALNKYEKSLEAVNEDLEKGISELAEFGGKMTAAGDKMTDISKDMTVKVSAPIAAIGAASVKLAGDFEKSLSQVQATMGITKDAVSELNGESVNTMQAMSDLAQNMGSETAFSASECADAINYLALAGYDTQQIYDTLPTVLNLAASGSMDLANASDMVTDAMSALGLGTGDATNMVDQMAKTASSSNTSVEQLGEALLQIGATGKTVAGGTSELNTALGILANNGIKGAEGGTHLRNILLALQTPTDQAKKQIDDLGVSVFDAEGNMRPMNEILMDLNQSMEGMTSEEKQNIIGKIFNTTDLASASALLDNCGESWNGLQNAIEESGGAAQQMADTQLDNMEGQLTKLKSATEGLMITLGTKLLPIITKIIEFLMKVIEKISGLSDGQKTMILIIAGVIAAIGPLLSIIGTVLGLIGSLSTASAALGIGIGALAGPIAIAVAAIAAIIAIGVLLWKNWDTIKEKAVSIKNNLVSAFNSLKTTIYSIFDSIKKAISDKISGAWDKVKEIADKIKNVFSFKWKLPDLKIPKITVSGGVAPFGIGGMGSLPKFSIKWMQDGGILNRPTAVTMRGNTIFAGGEAGAEAFLPLTKLKEYMRSVNAESVADIINILPELIGDIVYKSIIRAFREMRPGIYLDDEKIGEMMEELIRKVVLDG